MRVRTSPKTDAVARCIPRQDGGYLIVTHTGASGSSAVELREGEPVIISNGKATKP